MIVNIFKIDIVAYISGFFYACRFDELHYGRYVSLYTKGVFFFDAHPPLGKQLLYLAGHLAGYNGNFTFDRIGSPYSDSVPIKALRLVPAISGSLIVPMAYQLMLEISTYQWTAILAALLVLFGKLFKSFNYVYFIQYFHKNMLQQVIFVVVTVDLITHL